MAGNSICPKTGSVVIGKKGKYEIKNYLGGGGNGKVYEVDVIEERGLPQQSNGFAIKVFDIIPRNEDDPEYKKRRTRFLKKIKKVLSFQDKVRFIIPIYDASVLYDENQDYPWYLMPKAMRFTMPWSVFRFIMKRIWVTKKGSFHGVIKTALGKGRCSNGGGSCRHHSGM